MTKYNQSFKQQVIEFYLQNGKDRSLTRQHFQIKETTFHHWLAQYHHNGFNGFAVSYTKQIYSPEFKLSVVQAVKNGVFSTTKATLYCGIPAPALISQWLQAFDKQGINGLFPKPKCPPPKTEEERLRYCILELEAEVAVLKKWQELNQEKMRRFITKMTETTVIVVLR